MTKAEALDFLGKNPAFMVLTGLVALSFLTSPGKPRPDVPGLHGRRNAAWRGKGSYGKAPFGPQVSHRSR